MLEKPELSISGLIENDELMADAIRQGVREELLSHARAGHPVPFSENGEVIWLAPEEIYRRLDCVPPLATKAS
jgi:hypothetical protein